MQIFLARDGVEIGECPRPHLTKLARTGELLPSDHYWHEGMGDWSTLSELLAPEEWEPLPPRAPKPPAVVALATPVAPISSGEVTPWYRHRLAGPATIAMVLLGAALIAIIAINAGSSGGAARRNSLNPNARTVPTLSATEIRDQAAADLRQKIERLPARAEPPLNTFYYDVRVNMQKSLDRATPWSATIQGGENLIDPATQQTIRRTQFTLVTDYHNNVWVFRRYRATVTDLASSAITEIADDEQAPAPPSLVGMLGLKRESDGGAAPGLKISRFVDPASD